MSDDNHSVSLDMLHSQLTTLDGILKETLRKRRTVNRQLQDLLTGKNNPLAVSVLSSLQKLSVLKDDDQTSALQVWPSVFPGDAMSAGLQRVFVSGSEPLRIWDQARALFGHDVAMSFETDPREALNFCADQPNAILVLGWMTLAGSGQWWPVLNESRFHHLKITGVWPVCKTCSPYAAVVGHGPLNEPIGRSTVLIAHDDHHKVSRIFAEFDLKVHEFGRARSLVLFEVDERIAEDDARIKAAKSAGLDGLRVVGALPRYNRVES